MRVLAGEWNLQNDMSGVFRREIPFADLQLPAKDLELHPFARVGIDLCPPCSLCTILEDVVYTDGSYMTTTLEEDAPAAWAAVFLQKGMKAIQSTPFVDS